MDTARLGVPVIGVSGPERGGASAWHFTRLALARAGARAVRLTPRSRMAAERLDGLVLGGGADVGDGAADLLEPAPPPSRVPKSAQALDLLVAPALLLLRLAGQTRSHGVDPERDELERALLVHARTYELPVLGICRGAQLMNLAEGGTLARNLHTLHTERPHLYTVLPRREVRIAPQSALGRIFERDVLLVNSLHFHAVEEPGRALRVVAREPSGIAQAIEHERRRFWVGVQWHPEYLPQHRVHQRLFAALVAAARERRTQRATGG
jgi:putative glutamine amidotransferase